MAIKLNQFYTHKELSDEMNINERTFRRNIKEIHNYLNTYYDFMLLPNGRHNMYIFNKQYEDDIPEYKHRRNIQLFREDYLAIYEKAIDEEIAINPIFTPNSICQGMAAQGHSERTARGYIGDVLKCGKYVYTTVWAIKKYVPERYRMEWVEIGENALQEYRRLIRKHIGGSSALQDLEADLNEGLINDMNEYQRVHAAVMRDIWDKIKEEWAQQGNEPLYRKPKWEKGAF